LYYALSWRESQPATQDLGHQFCTNYHKKIQGRSFNVYSQQTKSAKIKFNAPNSAPPSLKKRMYGLKTNVALEKSL